MVDDFGEFCIIIGKDVPTYRTCIDCGDVEIVNPDAYDKPKTVCDPGYCDRLIPYCVCLDEALFDMDDLRKCVFPDCPCEAPPEIKEYE